MHRRHAVLLGLLLTVPALAMPGLFGEAPGVQGPPASQPWPEPPVPGATVEVATPALPTPRTLAPRPAGPGDGPVALARPAVEGATSPVPRLEARLAVPPPAARSFPVPEDLPELPVCQLPLPFDQLPPGMVFLVETRLPGEAPRVTPAVPFVWNPVDADGVLLDETGILGVDLLVQVLPDLTFGEFTIRIVRASPQALDALAPEVLDALALDEAVLDALPGDDLLATIPAMDVRLVLALSGGPEPGLVPQGCERKFLAAGYGYDTGAPPDRFEAVVDLEQLDEHDLYVETRLLLEQADPRLDLLLDVYDAFTYHGERARTLEVRATLHDLPPVFQTLLGVDTSAVEVVEQVADLGLPLEVGAALPPPLDALLDEAEVAAATATALDWRTETPLAQVTVEVHRHDATSATDVQLRLAPMPARLSEVLTSGAATTVTHDATQPLDLTLALDQFDRDPQGQATLVTRSLVDVQSLPEQVLFHLDGEHVDYAGSAPLGQVEVLHGNHPGPFPAAPGNHLLLDHLLPSKQSLSLRATGVLEAHWRDGPMRALDALVVGGQPFQVFYFAPEAAAHVGISALPSDLEVRSDFRTVLRYRADQPIPDLDVYAVTPNLTLDLRLDRVPTAVDATLDGHAVEVTLSEPLGGLVADLWFPHGLQGLPYTRVHAEATGIPGLAAAWDEAGTDVAVQALPPGAAIGSLLVQLTDDDTYLLPPPGEGAFVGFQNTTQQRATLRVPGLERTAVNLQGGLDLLYEAADGVPLDVQFTDALRDVTVGVADLPDRIRFLSDLDGLFSYEGSAPVGALVMVLTETTTGNATLVEVHGIPRSLLLLLDTGNATLDFDTGGETIGEVTAELVRPAGVGDTGVRHGRIHLEGMPGLHLRWAQEQVAFRTATGSLGLLHADLSSSIPMAVWPAPDEDLDRIVFWQEYPPLEQALNGPPEPTAVHIHAHVTGLREATVRSGEDRVVGDVRLADARPLDVVYHRTDGPCLTADVDLAVRDLPSFHVDTDLAGTILYEASAVIGEVRLFLQEQGRGFVPGTCLPVDQTRVEVHGVPTRMAAALSTDPVSAWFDASGPIGSVGVDLWRPREETRRILVNVTGIPDGFAATMDRARANLLFEADDPVESILFTASTDQEPVVAMDAAAFDAAVAALVARNLTDAQGGAHNTTRLKLVGLQSAALSLQQGALDADARLAPGPMYLDLLAEDLSADPPRANQTRVDTAGTSRAYNLTALPGERVRVATDRGLEHVLVQTCDEGVLFACLGNDTLAFLVGLPPVVDVRLTGLGAELDLEGQALEWLHLRAIGTEDPWDPKAVRSYLAATVTPVTSGHARFMDPGAIDVQFEAPAQVYLDLRSDIAHAVPFEHVHQDPTWDLGHYAIGVWTEAPSSVEGLDRDPARAVAARLGQAGEGVRAVQAFLDSNPVALNADFDLPEITFLAFESPVEPLKGLKDEPIPTWPLVYLGLRDPPTKFNLTLEDHAMIYPPRAYGDMPWAHDNKDPVRSPIGKVHPSPAGHKALRFETPGAAAGGEMNFMFSKPVPRGQAFYDGTDTQPETFFVVHTEVPEELVFDLYRDPNFYDVATPEPEMHEGSYLGINVEVPEMQHVNAFGSLPGNWFLQLNGGMQHVMFDYFQPHASNQGLDKPKNAQWIHLLSNADGLGVRAKKDQHWAWDAAAMTAVKTYDPDYYRLSAEVHTKGTYWLDATIYPQGCIWQEWGGVFLRIYYPNGLPAWDINTDEGWAEDVMCQQTIVNLDPEVSWIFPSGDAP